MSRSRRRRGALEAVYARRGGGVWTGSRDVARAAAWGRHAAWAVGLV